MRGVRGHMRYIVASIVLLLVALVGAWVMIFASIENFLFAGHIGYAILFILIPTVSAYGIANRKKWGVILSIIFFLPQCINYVSQSLSFQFMAPISLGLTFNGREEGTNYIFNIFAIGMATYMIFLLVSLQEKTPNKRMQSDRPTAGR